MKTLKLTLTFALTLLVGISFAQFPQSSSPESNYYEESDLRASIYEGNPDFIHVKVAKKLGDKVKIRVKGEDKTIFVQNYKKYSRVNVQYDIREFPLGSYTFEVLKGKEVVFSTTINKNNNESYAKQ